PKQWDDGSFAQAVEGTMQHPPPHLWFVRYLPSFVSRIIAKRILSHKKEFRCTLKTISQLIAEHDIERIDLLKIDCEGAELEALQGISDEDWGKVSQAVIEVRDIDGRLANIKALLSQNGLQDQAVEKEEGLEKTNLYNIFAKRRDR
ncbi:MAG: FkbM family methyltransferase, partial [Myxococcota bacterium]|nr:FkbM family methyltransferase [Myxococcota bacterium]